MALIDDFARREDITKATVITRALDCMQASYDSGHGGMPVTGGGAGGASDAELEELRAKLKKAEERATDAERALQSAEDRLRDAQRQRDEAENRARDAQSDLATAQAQSANVSSNDNRRTEAAEEEVERLRALVAKQAATLEEKIRALASKEVGYDDQARTLANKDAEISSRDAIIADRDKQITELRSQLSEAQARSVEQCKPRVAFSRYLRRFDLHGRVSCRCHLDAQHAQQRYGCVQAASQRCTHLGRARRPQSSAARIRRCYQQGAQRWLS